MSTLAYKNAVERSIDRDIDRAIVSGFNFEVCENCGHALSEQLPGRDAQIWACIGCGSMRQWGFFQPFDSRETPALGCDQCGTTTRHTFLGIAGRVA